MKKCSTCKTEKTLIEFSKKKTTKDGLSYECRECKKQYRIKNADKLKQYSILIAPERNKKAKLYYQQNKITIFERSSPYRKKYYLINKIAIGECNKKYAQTEKGKLVKRIIYHRRRALLRVNTPIGKHFTTADIILKLKLQKYKCIYCETSIKNDYEIDHIIAVTKGGSNESSNIQLLCKQCNGAGGKGRKLPHEFASKHGMLF